MHTGERGHGGAEGTGRGGGGGGAEGESLDLRARFTDLNWIVSLKGCSNDFWILNSDGIAGVWLGSADSDERHTFKGVCGKLSMRCVW